MANSCRSNAARAWCRHDHTILPIPRHRLFRCADADQQDAYTVCRWLQETDQARELEAFFAPALAPEDLATAGFEGWILGVMPASGTGVVPRRRKTGTRSESGVR